MALPTEAEWSTRNLPEARRAYLEGGFTFESIVALVCAEAEIAESYIGRYRDHSGHALEESARQAVFRIHVSGKACDLFFNSRDGVRGRYWQSPEAGIAADAQIIKAVTPLLLDLARKTPPPAQGRITMPMTIDDVRHSLETPSAKIWPYEYGGPGQLSQPVGPEALWVARWETNEAEHQTRWRWTPSDRDLVIKGALIDANGGPHVPAAKADRARQIHLYGFT